MQHITPGVPQRSRNIPQHLRFTVYIKDTSVRTEGRCNTPGKQRNTQDIPQCPEQPVYGVTTYHNTLDTYHNTLNTYHNTPDIPQNPRHIPQHPRHIPQHPRHHNTTDTYHNTRFTHLQPHQDGLSGTVVPLGRPVRYHGTHRRACQVPWYPQESLSSTLVPPVSPLRYPGTPRMACLVF